LEQKVQMKAQELALSNPYHASKVLMIEHSNGGYLLPAYSFLPQSLTADIPAMP
jgi:hypothetical protein